MKKIISLVLMIVMLLSFTTGAYAKYYDVPSNASYTDALDRLSALGIMSGTGYGTFNPNDIITREQFAKIIVIAAGLDDAAKTLKGPTVFPDVEPSSWASGYINEAVSKGFINGMADGKFHSGDSITFAQVCTIMLKALGYTDQDVPGLWPGNYIEKVRTMGLIDGINLKNNDSVHRWEAAVMLDRLLDTNIKKSSAGEADKTFAAANKMTMDDIYSVYSKPEIARSFNAAGKKIGSISLAGYPSVVRNTIDISTSPATNKQGEAITIYDIKENNIVYEVSDKWGKNRYILVVDNKVNGKITGILPNKYSPKTVQVDNKNYDLDKYMNMNKINSSKGAFNIGDSVVLLLGHDGKIVDMLYPESSDNSNYAFVINFTWEKSKDMADYGKEKYTVKLLMTDGTTQTYKVDYDPTDLKGKLVQYLKKDLETVALTEITYLDGDKNHDIAKDDRHIDSNYVTDNIKIFNLVSDNQGYDAQAKLINWTDLPHGTLPAGKILYMNRVGAFQDINVLLVNDIFEEQYKMAVVTKIDYVQGRKSNTYSYSLLIDGNEFTYSTYPKIPDVEVGRVIKFRMINGAIDSLKEIMNPAYTSTVVDAIDTERIKTASRIFKFKENVVIYFKDYDGKVTVKGTNDIEINKVYSNIDLYTDRPLAYGGIVEAIVINK